MDPKGSSGNQGVEKEIIPGGSRGLLRGPEVSRGAPEIPRKSSGLKRKENKAKQSVPFSFMSGVRWF